MIFNNKVFFFFIGILSILISISCKESTSNRKLSSELYRVKCSGCHILPSPSNITKEVWSKSVLPEMAARMGYRYDNYNPLLNYSSLEYQHIYQSKTYPKTATIDSLEWKNLMDYVISNAPDSIPINRTRGERNNTLNQFSPKLIVLDSNTHESITSIGYSDNKNKFFVGGALGSIWEFPKVKKIGEKNVNSAVTSYMENDDTNISTHVGILNPSERKYGEIHITIEDSVKIKLGSLHRPVHTLVNDINMDGQDDILVCEFGHFTGELSLFDGAKSYKKHTLLPFPGAIKSEIVDLNNDGKKDIVVLVSQGTESIYVLYQKDNLEFSIDRLLTNSPEFGSSWFEVIDFNLDGYLDIILTNGDNADYSDFPKPYHGLSLYLNNGKNQFNKKYFYPIYGATRVLTHDFDFDGDLDFAILSFFPEMTYTENENFIYLENIDSENFIFKAFTIDKSSFDRWMVMEKGDIDNDGDFDLILGAFSLSLEEEYLDRINGKTKLLILVNNRQVPNY